MLSLRDRLLLYCLFYRYIVPTGQCYFLLLPFYRYTVPTGQLNWFVKHRLPICCPYGTGFCFIAFFTDIMSLRDNATFCCYLFYRYTVPTGQLNWFVKHRLPIYCPYGTGCCFIASFTDMLSLRDNEIGLSNIIYCPYGTI
jgi:hypothetical protein